MTARSPAAHPFFAAIDRIAPRLDLVESAMREQLRSASGRVGELGGHVLGSGGKRIRPALLLLSAELCGYTGARCVQVAAAVELLHTATLLHDDVVDFSELRRQRPSANALWGNRRAVLAGDFLYARASSMIVEDGNPDLLWIFANTIRAMAEGELLQLERSFDATVTESHYFSVIERKSAVLLTAACEAGAILGGVLSALMGGLGITVGLGFYLPFNIVLTYSLGTLSRELSDRFKGKDWSDGVGIPIAAGFIVGEALVGVGDAISKVIEGAMG